MTLEDLVLCPESGSKRQVPATEDGEVTGSASAVVPVSRVIEFAQDERVFQGHNTSHGITGSI
jgi:hypothetical protein